MSTKISALTAASTIDATADYLPIVTSSLSATQKINRNTLLGITGSPIGSSDSQTLSNKTLDNTSTINIKGTKFSLQDDTDTTKQARFIMSGITTGTIRSYTLPNTSDTIVTLGASQTLTSKTLTTPTITSPTVSGTVAGAATYSTPTLTTPTITDFTNATHNHSNAAGGGTTLTNPSITTPTITTPTFQNWDGWISANESWTFGNSTTINVPSDATTKYYVGDKIKLTQSATVKYFYIIGVTSTTLTITGGSDYTFTNNTVTNNFYSHEASPLNFPQWFNYTMTFVGFSANPANPVARFAVSGRVCTTTVLMNASGTSNSISFQVNTPITPGASAATTFVCGQGTDNGVALTTPIMVNSAASTANFQIFKDLSNASWTASGSKKASFEISYEI